VNIHVVNPLLDSRWDELGSRHPLASAFHQRGWLEALERTYGYRSFAITSTPPGQPLADAVVFSSVSSWITGNRAVSLPFADHCDALLNDSDAMATFVDWLRGECTHQHWRYAELRPRMALDPACLGLKQGSTYSLHELDLDESLEQVFRRLDKDSFQRRIRRAEKEQLAYEVGLSSELLDAFYGLLLTTRRRHRMLPQPRAWFQNLVECMAGSIEIRLARKNGSPVAALLSLRHGTTVVYKYGCSDSGFHYLGAMPFLFWRLIEESKARGAQRLDLGRSDLDNPGLIAFKDRFGASKRPLTYYRCGDGQAPQGASRWHSRPLRRLFSLLPDTAFSTAGRLLYRHLG